MQSRKRMKMGRTQMGSGKRFPAMPSKPWFDNVSSWRTMGYTKLFLFLWSEIESERVTIILSRPSCHSPYFLVCSGLRPNQDYLDFFPLHSCQPPINKGVRGLSLGASPLFAKRFFSSVTEIINQGKY